MTADIAELVQRVQSLETLVLSIGYFLAAILVVAGIMLMVSASHD